VHVICRNGETRRRAVTEVISVLNRLHGKRPRRLGDPSSLVADAARVMRDLGWTPKFTKIVDSISTVWRWMHNEMAQSVITNEVS
jgi:UDP-glucose 4-epimerase